jgi:hypothetical protein
MACKTSVGICDHSTWCYTSSVRVFKTKWFSRWARKQGVEDAALLMAVAEMAAGLVDADLGGHVVKKRIPLAVTCPVFSDHPLIEDGALVG